MTTPFLQMDYTYNARDLITGIVETDELQQQSTIVYEYDNRGRLIEECRTGTHSYHLAYEYDQGGNRTRKTDWSNDTCTLYHYDSDPGSTAPHRANRLMSYETRELVGTECTGELLENVIYEYALDGPAAGNVTQILRKVPDLPFWWWYRVYSTCFKYNSAGELWVATNRTWRELVSTGEPVSDDETWKCRQFRGLGRARYMMRELDTSNVIDPSFDILPDTAAWTDFDYPWPTGDYTIDAEGDPVSATRYELGLAQMDPSGEVFYFHADQIGTTRAMTDDPLPPGSGGDPPTITTRPVYTAFGQVVYEDGTVGTRYRYAGSWGYENFAALDWGTVDWGTGGDPEPLAFPYLHVGHRTYDPATGRFLQRDPIGIRGELDVYEYVGSRATVWTDSLGLGNDNSPSWHPGGINTPPGWEGSPYPHLPLPAPKPPTKPLTPQQELERIKKKVRIAGVGSAVWTCLGQWYMMAGWGGAVLIDQLIHYDEPLNPVFGGSYEYY